MRKLAVLLIALLGLALLLGGCGDDDDAGESTTSGRASMDMQAPAATPGFREQAPAREQDTGGETNADRKEVITGQVEITSADPVDAAGKVTAQVTTLKGRVDSRTERPGTGDSDPSARLTVRIPAEHTDAFIAGLGDIGEVTEVSTNRDDVTMQWQDLDARISALQASVDRLRVLMAEATNTADLLAAEQALSSRQADLDSLTAQKRLLDDQIALSTLTIEISSTHTDSDDGPTNFWDGIVSGWNSLVDWLKDAVVFLGKAVPWIGFVAVIGAVVWVIVRLVRRPRGTTAAATRTPAESEAGKATATTGESSADDGSGDDKTEQP
ncbi:DUF4349 domain-containing protein [Nocardia cyriacigeorgica]|uniref:DUF4349 domain-containing protein n=1 Tax=Nocardia cyriacigeorgica TaxID=135487 RepID=A0A6P1DIE9_9NOCA|nr:DUF4349 domain-containing protein [Nocardia cyriacigeorgica]NEW39157.1 DUF4349 domain-containing protein [Nocardia cyriacigeorgica]NEW48182.1 DUF4349 domain-containing protein [Nocardia cyriacigeorgica]NEW53484.1 DUF4349 domain-containing protein [Nocardia cyriacigeorgica]NEW56891.1 DUF4349 domain-containing protein [Nocardia cyriacigeorgica]